MLVNRFDKALAGLQCATKLDVVHIVSGSHLPDYFRCCRAVDGIRKPEGDLDLDLVSTVSLEFFENTLLSLPGFGFERVDYESATLVPGHSCGRQIEAFPTVYHAVATVQGQLTSPPQPQRIIEILKATFPGGSITGAPKIRSMEIIDELEPTARGVYTGSVGWIGLNFDLCWNIVIRTILVSGQKAYTQTGGGIVADSESGAEWDETLTKARALLAGIEAVNRTDKRKSR